MASKARRLGNMKIGVTRFTTLISLVFGFAYNAHAISITPANAFASGNQTGGPQVLAAAATACGCTLTQQYKQDAGSGETGSLANSYNATITPAGDADSFQITYTGGSSVGPTAWLIVKGGNSPGWYLFNLNDLGWNGTDTINGSGFWPQQGSVGFVELFGNTSPPPTPLPAPSPLLLLGSGMLGMGIVRRKRQR
jgi:hypothetical protein